MAWSRGALAALATAAAAWPLGLYAAADGCAGRLAASLLDQRLGCLERLGRSGQEAEPAAPAVVDLLAASGEATDPRLVAAALDVLRAAGPASRGTREAVSRLLPYRSPLYRDRDKLLVVRLRAYLLATLAEIGFPPSAEPALVDALAYVDEQTPALELAAAARSVRALPEARGRAYVPYLLESIHLRIADEEVSLERFEPDFPRAEATTPQLEAVRSLGRVVSAEDREAVALLARLAEYRGETLDPRLVEEARIALTAVAERVGEPSGPVPSAGPSAGE